MPKGDSFGICPAVPLAGGLVAGILVVVALAEPEVSPWWLALVAGLGASPPLRRGWRGFLAGAAAGLVLAVWHLAGPWRHWDGKPARIPAGVEADVVVVSAWVPGSQDPSVQAPTRLQARLRRIRSAGTDWQWRPVSGRVQLCWRGAGDWSYGDRYAVRGVLRGARGAPFPGGFSERLHLLSRGVHGVLDVDAGEFRSGAAGWRRVVRGLYALRSYCADVVVQGVARDQHRALLRAMTLGLRESVDSDTRQVLIRSGTIHILAISGLHTGIAGVALLLGLGLLRVPFRVRYALLPLLLGGYVFLSGGAPSAVRAWVMLSTWAVLKSRLHPVVPVNSVALSAVVLLVVNPLNLLRTGFLFSFVIVFALVLGWQRGARVLAVLRERALWIPMRMRGRRLCEKPGRWLAEGFLGSGLAWFGGAGLVMSTNGLLIPGSIVVNLLLLPCVAGSMALASAKLVLGLWQVPVFPALLAKGLGTVLTAIEILAGFGAGNVCSWRCGCPPVPLVVLYYALLVAALVPGVPRPQRAARAAAALCVLLLAVCWPRLTRTAPSVTALWGQGIHPPSLVVTYGRARGPVVLNTGGWRRARRIDRWLASRGFDTVDALICTGVSYPYAGGIDAIAGRHAIRTILAPAGTWGAGHFPAPVRQRNWQETFVRGVRMGALPGGVCWSTRRRGGSALSGLRLREGRQSLRVTLQDLPGGVAHLRIRFPDGRHAAMLLPGAREAAITTWCAAQ